MALCTGCAMTSCEAAGGLCDSGSMGGPCDAVAVVFMADGVGGVGCR